jgi:hypothetical protein
MSLEGNLGCSFCRKWLTTAMETTPTGVSSETWCATCGTQEILVALVLKEEKITELKKELEELLAPIQGSSPLKLAMQALRDKGPISRGALKSLVFTASLEQEELRKQLDIAIKAMGPEGVPPLPPEGLG